MIVARLVGVWRKGQGASRGAAPKRQLQRSFTDAARVGPVALLHRLILHDHLDQAFDTKIEMNHVVYKLTHYTAMLLTSSYLITIMLSGAPGRTVASIYTRSSRAPRNVLDNVGETLLRLMIQYFITTVY